MKYKVEKVNPDYVDDFILAYQKKGWTLKSNQRCQEIDGGNISTFNELTFEADDSASDVYKWDLEGAAKIQYEYEKEKDKIIEQKFKDAPKAMKHFVIGVLLMVLAFIGFIVVICLQNQNLLFILFPLFIIGALGLALVIKNNDGRKYYVKK